MSKFYFTFPQSCSLRNGYMIVEAGDRVEASKKTIDMYGKIIYAFIYGEDEFLPQIDKYHLYEIPFGYMPEDEAEIRMRGIDDYDEF